MIWTKKQKRIDIDHIYGASGFALCVCLVLVACIPVVSAYDSTTASKVVARGYNPDEFTLEYVGYSAVNDANITEESWALLDTFYVKYHDILPSRWGGREEPSAELIPVAYIFRVLPDGSTMSYFDYGDRNEELASIQKRADIWKQKTLLEATKNTLTAPNSDPSLIGRSESVNSFKPYGKLDVSSLYYWDNKDSSTLEQIFITNYPRIEPGDYLHNHGEGEFKSGWFADQLIFKQYIDQTTGSYNDLPDVSITKYDPTAPHEGPYKITISIKDSGEVSVSLPFTLFDGDTSSAGSSGGSWMNWEEHFKSIPWLSQGAKEGNTLSSGALLTCTKATARNGNTYVFTKNVIYPNKAFKNLLSYKPENENNIEKYMTAKWYNGGWDPQAVAGLNSPKL